MTCRLIVVAAGGLGRETSEAARASGIEVLGFVDEGPSLWGREVDGLPVLGDLKTVRQHPDAGVVLCAGKGHARVAMARKLSALGFAPERFMSVIHPDVRIPESCRIGSGSVLLAGTVLTASVTLGRHAVCMPHVTLTHDDVIGDFVTLCAGTTLGGGVQVGFGAYVGAVAAIREGVAVGVGAVVGMGAVVLEDIPAGETWVGVPAKPLVAKVR